MGRKIIGVIVGYIAMAVVIFLSFTAAYLAMGANQAFKPGVYDVSLRWAAISIVLSLIAAIVGGYVCTLIARGTRAAQILAGLVIVLGILVAIPVLTGRDTRPNKRPEEVPNLQAMQSARTPKWVAILNPIVGAVGVLVGAGIRQKTARID
jgi:ABC-type transport system involved in multi-copper enzyme maturation permease subunit